MLERSLLGRGALIRLCSAQTTYAFQLNDWNSFALDLRKWNFEDDLADGTLTLGFEDINATLTTPVVDDGDHWEEGGNLVRFVGAGESAQRPYLALRAGCL